MKNSFATTAVAIGAAALLSFGTKADAALINITNDMADPAELIPDYNKGDVGSLGEEVVFNFLVATVAAYNADINPGSDLPDPVGGGSGGYESLGSTTGSFDASLYTYAVTHYGKGKDGEGKGGGIVVWYLNGMTGPMDLPDRGNGPNGNGGESFTRLYGPGGNTSVPDSGMTLILLGLGLGAMGAFAKFKPAKAG